MSLVSCCCLLTSTMTSSLYLTSINVWGSLRWHLMIIWLLLMIPYKFSLLWVLLWHGHIYVDNTLMDMKLPDYVTIACIFMSVRYSYVLMIAAFILPMTYWDLYISSITAEDIMWRGVLIYYNSSWLEMNSYVMFSLSYMYTDSWLIVFSFWLILEQLTIRIDPPIRYTYVSMISAFIVLLTWLAMILASVNDILQS